MSPAARAALAAAAALGAAGPAAAYEQSCPSASRCLRWNAFEVAWTLNPAQGGSAPTCTTGAVEAAAVAAFGAWEGAARAGEGAPCASLALPYAGRTDHVRIGRGTDGEHLVVLRRGWCSEDPDAANDPCFEAGTCGSTFNCFDDGGPLDRGTLAVTLVRYERGSGHIVDADVEVAAWSGEAGSVASGIAGWYYTCFEPAQSTPTCATYGQAGCVYQDLQNTLTHEAGHFVGLAHPPPSSSAAVTMYPTAPPRETQKRTLAEDDVAGMCAIYPLGRTLDAEPAGGCGCATGGPGGAVWLVALLAALLPRRRLAARVPARRGPGV